MNSKEIENMIISRRNEKQREILMRFFRTAPGQYGEGDEFLGLKVPETRAVVKEARRSVALDDISRLLASKWHEVRLAGLLLLVEEMNVALPRKKDNEAVAEAKTQRREQLATFYITHARQANNWDLVDLSCQVVLGPYIYLSGRYDILSILAASDNLWEQRIAVVTTLHFIRQGLWQPTFDIC
ncbi:MAG: DNA alkylation repair protein, partial [Duncaniella sp.]|nr:DNA alkylation repair protein [Duncaniella sp.]